MSKSETVLELQELLKDMRSITVDLNRSISSLKEILDVEEFIPTSLGEKIRTYLEKINEKQTEFVSKYEALNSREPNTKYVVLENELEEAKKVFEENDRYVNGIKFFLSLHSDDEKTENILQNRKNTLNNLNIDAMERDDLQSLADTYSIGKISAINSESLAALMEEMCELNVLQHTGDGRYRFTRHSFCQMMGTVQQIEDELMNYMED